MIITASYQITLHASCSQVWHAIRGRQFLPLVYKTCTAGSGLVPGKARLPSWCIPGRTVAWDRNAAHSLALADGTSVMDSARIDAVRYELESRGVSTRVRLVVEYDAMPGQAGLVRALLERLVWRQVLAENLKALRQAVEPQAEGKVSKPVVASS